jgi:hypothetical protein
MINSNTLITRAFDCNSFWSKDFFDKIFPFIFFNKNFCIDNFRIGSSLLFQKYKKLIVSLNLTKIISGFGADSDLICVGLIILIEFLCGQRPHVIHKSKTSRLIRNRVAALKFNQPVLITTLVLETTIRRLVLSNFWSFFYLMVLSLVDKTSKIMGFSRVVINEIGFYSIHKSFLKIFFFRDLFGFRRTSLNHFLAMNSRIVPQFCYYEPFFCLFSLKSYSFFWKGCLLKFFHFSRLDRFDLFDNQPVFEKNG